MGYVQEARENHVKKKVEEGIINKPLNPFITFYEFQYYYDLIS